jgi:DNA-binding NarL/FixJ family response regulator
MTTTSVIRVLIADDQMVNRQGILTMLESAEDIEVVAEADNGPEAVTYARYKAVDVALVGFHMPGADGGDVTQKLVKLDPAPRVIALLTFENDEDTERALEAGADRVLLKGEGPEKFIGAVRAAANGGSSSRG